MDKCFFCGAAGINAIAQASAEPDDWKTPAIVGSVSTICALWALNKRIKSLQVVGDALELDEDVQMCPPDRYSVIYALAGQLVGILAGKAIRYACREANNKMFGESDDQKDC